MPNDVEEVCFEEGGEVSFEPDKVHQSFIVDHLIGNLCIENNKGLSFRLENIVSGDGTSVKITGI